jgi:hypothetical protein
MPDHCHALAKHVFKNVLAVVIAIAAGKNENSDLHFFPLFKS